MLDDHTTIDKQEGFDSQAPRLVRSVPPASIRLTKLLGHLRVHLRSAGRQIGPDGLLEFVRQVIHQDLQDKPYIES